jgi:hypothetical protein
MYNLQFCNSNSNLSQPQIVEPSRGYANVVKLLDHTGELSGLRGDDLAPAWAQLLRVRAICKASRTGFMAKTRDIGDMCNMVRWSAKPYREGFQTSSSRRRPSFHGRRNCSCSRRRCHPTRRRSTRRKSTTAGYAASHPP